MKADTWKVKSAAVLAAAVMAVPVIMPVVGYAYDNITNEVIQINDFLDRGLYLEAMQNCVQTKAWHYLSPEDIEILEELYNDAQGAYNNYLKYGTMYLYEGTWTCTPPGESAPLIELQISNASNNSVHAYATRIRGKGVEYYIGTAYRENPEWYQSGGSIAYTAYGTSEYAIYHLYFKGSYIALDIEHAGGEYETYYFYR